MKYFVIADHDGRPCGYMAGYVPGCMVSRYAVEVPTEARLVELLEGAGVPYGGLTHPKPTGEALLEQENKRLKAQVQALSDRGDFLEDCLAEMAGAVYR